MHADDTNCSRSHPQTRNPQPSASNYMWLSVRYHDNGIHTHTHTNQVTTSGAGHTITATIYNSIATDDEIWADHARFKVVGRSLLLHLSSNLLWCREADTLSVAQLVKRLLLQWHNSTLLAYYHHGYSYSLTCTSILTDGECLSVSILQVQNQK